MAKGGKESIIELGWDWNALSAVSTRVSWGLHAKPSLTRPAGLGILAQALTHPAVLSELQLYEGLPISSLEDFKKVGATTHKHIFKILDFEDWSKRLTNPDFKEFCQKPILEITRGDCDRASCWRHIMVGALQAALSATDTFKGNAAISVEPIDDIESEYGAAAKLFGELTRHLSARVLEEELRRLLDKATKPTPGL